MSSGAVMLTVLVVVLGWLIFHQLHRPMIDAASKWPSAAGTVTRSQLRTREAGGRSAAVYYYPEVQYRYSVEGQQYHGFRVSFSPVQTPSAEEALELLSRIPPGASVSVRYNPDFPADSVLDGVSLHQAHEPITR